MDVPATPPSVEQQLIAAVEAGEVLDLDRTTITAHHAAAVALSGARLGLLDCTNAKLRSDTGPALDAPRDAHLVRNNEAVNLDMLLLGELRVLTGMKRQRDA